MPSGELSGIATVATELGAVINNNCYLIDSPGVRRSLSFLMPLKLISAPASPIWHEAGQVTWFLGV